MYTQSCLLTTPWSTWKNHFDIIRSLDSGARKLWSVALLCWCVLMHWYVLHWCVLHWWVLHWSVCCWIGVWCLVLHWCVVLICAALLCAAAVECVLLHWCVVGTFGLTRKASRSQTHLAVEIWSKVSWILIDYMHKTYKKHPQKTFWCTKLKYN